MVPPRQEPTLSDSSPNGSSPRDSRPTSNHNGQGGNGNGGRGRKPWLLWLLGRVTWFFGGLIGRLILALLCVGASGALLLGVAIMTAYPRLPDIPELQSYAPALPLRIYSEDKMLLGEFGAQRRDYYHYEEIPAVMRNAVLAIEDRRYFEHGGVDLIGVVRAAKAYLLNHDKQGASTITMQVARNFYLPTERAFKRKFYEALLAMKIENSLSKEKILEIYLNQIFLGNRSYGFAAASRSYFGKDLTNITAAEAALLAGLPKAPSEYNPLRNPARALERQHYILERMRQFGYLNEEQYQQALAQKLNFKGSQQEAQPQRYAQFVSETVRQMMVDEFGEDAYTRGFSVYTTINFDQQLAAYRALRAGMVDYDKRHAYRGPEQQVDLGVQDDPVHLADTVATALADVPDSDVFLAAVVISADPKLVRVMRFNGDVIEVTGEGLAQARSHIGAKDAKGVRRGSVVRVQFDRSNPKKPLWRLVQLPEIEGALVSLAPGTGDIRAMVGGFDYDRNKFNHATQAWRQPGSSFKPFIYSAALEKGVYGGTIVNDAPIRFDSGSGPPWEPKNYDGTYDGPIPLHVGLAKSKNMVSIRLIDFIGTQYAQQWASNFGFDPARNPPYLTLALGAGSVTPLQMAQSYAVFANGGLRITPRLVTRVLDPNGKVVKEFPAPPLNESNRAISARNAYVMDTLLGEVAASGTGARARSELKRSDLYGKTGTTNDSQDAWFCGFQPTQVTVVWLGYDTPKSLGTRETGGGAALPIWIDFMRFALQNVPDTPYVPPEGAALSQRDGLPVFSEFAGDEGIASIGLDDSGQTTLQIDEKERQEMLRSFESGSGAP